MPGLGIGCLVGFGVRLGYWGPEYVAGCRDKVLWPGKGFCDHA